MNRKGFTLVELLIMLVVLGILMLITVPNIAGIIENNKLKFVKADAIKMVDTAKMKLSTEKDIEKPSDGECIVFALNYLDDNEDIKKGPNGGKYLQFDSFVLVKRSGAKYNYYVRLVEKTSKNFGLDLVLSENLSTDNLHDYIKVVDTNYNMDGTDDDKAKLNSAAGVRSICSSSGVKEYYPGVIIN